MAPDWALCAPTRLERSESTPPERRPKKQIKSCSSFNKSPVHGRYRATAFRPRIRWMLSRLIAVSDERPVREHVVATWNISSNKDRTFRLARHVHRIVRHWPRCRSHLLFFTRESAGSAADRAIWTSGNGRGREVSAIYPGYAQFKAVILRSDLPRAVDADTVAAPQQLVMPLITDADAASSGFGACDENIDNTFCNEV
jgi:hypothetical protein